MCCSAAGEDVSRRRDQLHRLQLQAKNGKGNFGEQHVVSGRLEILNQCYTDWVFNNGLPIIIRSGLSLISSNILSLSVYKLPIRWRIEFLRLPALILNAIVKVVESQRLRPYHTTRTNSSRMPVPWEALIPFG